MATTRPREDLKEKLRRSRRTLERQLKEGDASCNAQQALDRVAEIRKQDDTPNPSFVQQGKA